MAEQIVVTESMLSSLRATRPWVQFLAILGFVFTGLMLVVGLGMFAAFSLVPASPGMPHFIGPMIGAFYMLMAVFFYLIPCLYLYRYARAIESIPNSGQGALEQALFQQKSFWKYLGIFAIVLLALYALLIVGAIGFGVMTAMSHHG